MKTKIYRLLGEIGSYPDGNDGEKYEEIDVTISTTKTDALIIRDAIAGGYDGDVQLFEKETDKEVSWFDDEEMEQDLDKLLESDMSVEEIAELLESKMSLEKIAELLKLT